MFLDAVWDVVKMLVGMGAAGWLGSLMVATLKQVGLVKKMHLEDLLDQVAARVVAYVQDVAKESGATGEEQREAAVRAMVEKTGVSATEAEERVRAAYQRMKGGQQ